MAKGKVVGGMDQLLRDVLNATKELHGEISALDIDPTIKRSLKTRAASANKAAVGIRKRVAESRVSHETQLRILVEAVKEELIDRDANAARVADKHRVAAERASSSLDSRAEASVAMINAAIAGLCPWQYRVSASTPLLANNTNALPRCQPRAN